MILWGVAMGSGSRLLLCLTFLLFVLVPSRVHSQAVQLAKITGTVRVARGDVPVHPVLVSLEMRGSVVASAYSEDTGRVGFYNLPANEYKVTVNDDAYEPFSATVELDPTKSPQYFVQITLVPRPGAKKDPLPGRVEGSNPYLVDPADYYRKFPKKTVKEFKKGVDSDHNGNPDDAIDHYQKALSLSPDFYPAHNNLGTIYLSRQNFDAAQAQFEDALKANQNDVEAYFNLANVLLTKQRYPDAEREIAEGLQRQPESAFGNFLQGLLYSRTARPELAEKSLQRAVQIDPKMSQAHLQLVNLYLQQKRTPEAIGELQTYLKAFPDSPFSPKARELLKRLQPAAPK
jgi:tetratricopeptide (TPR) repeat protein